MIGQITIAIALPGFNDLGSSVTPIFLLIDHFLYRFSKFSKKSKKIYKLEVWIFWKLQNRISLFFALHSSLRRFQMPLEELSFVKMLATFGIIYAKDPLPQNMTKIVCLHWLTFDIFNYNITESHPLKNVARENANKLEKGKKACVSSHRPVNSTVNNVIPRVRRAHKYCFLLRKLKHSPIHRRIAVISRYLD